MKKEKTRDRLKKIMIDRGLRQIDILNKTIPFCKKYNVKLGRNDLSQYISGKVEPSQKKLTILAEALNVSEVWLMGYDVPENENTLNDFITPPEWEKLSINFTNMEKIIENMPKDICDYLNLDYEYGPSSEYEVNFGLENYSTIYTLQETLFKLRVIKNGITLSNKELENVINFIKENKEELRKEIAIKHEFFLNDWKRFCNSPLYKKYVEETARYK